MGGNMTGKHRAFHISRDWNEFNSWARSESAQDRIRDVCGFLAFLLVYAALFYVLLH